MMYTIDLLKGHGIPIRNRRGGLLIIIITAAVPVIIAMVFYTQYMLNSINIERAQASIIDRDKKIAQMSDSVKALSSLEKENLMMKGCLAEIPTAIDRNVQWSPILRLIVENMPASTVLNKLNVSLVQPSKQVTDKADPTKQITVQQNLRTLQISLFEYSKSDNGEGVHQFIRALRSSNVLAGKVDDIRIAAQERDKAGSAEVTRYDIDCIFKPQG